MRRFSQRCSGRILARSLATASSQTFQRFDGSSSLDSVHRTTYIAARRCSSAGSVARVASNLSDVNQFMANEKTAIDLDSSQSSGEGGSSSTSSPQPNIPSQIMLGFVLLGGGIVAINLNERRAVKQNLLNDFCEEQVESVEELQPWRERELNGKLIHANGPIAVTAPPPRDEVLGVEALQDQLRLKREVEMYQWQEHSHTKEVTLKDGSKSTVTTYTYSERWASTHLSTQDNRNPAFPHYAPVKEAGALHLTSLKRLRLLLSNNFVCRLVDWVDSDVAVADSKAAARHGLRMVSGSENQLSGKGYTGFYSATGTPMAPVIGDVRVSYKAIEPGIHTALGKFGISKTNAQQSELQPFTAKLRSSLATEDEIIVPAEAHYVAQQAGYPLFVIPDGLAAVVEKLVLSVAPLEFAMLARGVEGKQSAFSHHRNNCDTNTDSLFYYGAASCVFGVFFISSPIGMVSTNAQLFSAVSSGLGIAYTSRTNAKQQLETTIKQRKPTKSAPGSGHDADI